MCKYIFGIMWDKKAAMFYLLVDVAAPAQSANFRQLHSKSTIITRRP